MSKVTIERELLERIPLNMLKTYGYGQTAHKIQAILDTHPAPESVSGGNEPVEVVGYAGRYQLELRHLFPQYPGMKIKKESSERYTEPLMTVAQHNRIMAATVPAGSRVVPVELLERVCREDGASNDIAMEELRALLGVKP